MSDPSAPQDPFAGLPPEPDDSSPASGSQPPAYGSEPPPYGQPPVTPPYGAQPPATPPPYGQPPVTPPPYGQPPVSPPPYGQPAAYGVQPPAYGSPPYPQPGGYAQPAYAFPKNSLAVWSLVLGIVSFVLCGFFAAIPAIIVGNKAKQAVAEGQANNGGMATAGVILGWVNLALTVIVVIIVIIGVVTGNSSGMNTSNL